MYQWIAAFLILAHTHLAYAETSYIDMTYTFDQNTIYWPTATSFKVTSSTKTQSTLGYWYESNDFCASEHGGTHLDSPVHFSKGKWSVEEIPFKNLIGKGVVVDIKDKAKANADAELQVEDLLAWEKKYGRIPDGAIVMMNSGWGQHWSNRTKYLGNDRNDTSDLHFPGISPAAAEWIVKQRKVYGVGVDTPSVDHGPSKLFSTHTTLYTENVYGLENMANLDAVPASGATIFVMPMHIRGGSGAPARIFAMVNDAPSGCISTKCNLPSLILVCLITILSFLLR